MESEAQVVVRVEGVAKDFRSGLGLRAKRVLHGISFGVERGEIFGFVGPNGAGKTTTLKILMGLIRSTEGKASVLDRDVAEISYRRQIGFLPENPYFYHYLTGREILHFYAKLSGVPASSRTHQVDKLLDWVGLTHAAESRLRTYSKGMLQRTGIAQALVHDPSVVFLDEPMSGLDPIGRKEIRDLIVRLRREGKTVFMNTHILSDVETLCDRVAIIVEGRIRFQGRVEDFREVDRRSDVVLSDLDSEEALRLEECYGAEMRGVGSRIEFRVDEKQTNDLLTDALRVGARVVTVAPHRVSLESIFMTAVKGGNS